LNDRDADARVGVAIFSMMRARKVFFRALTSRDDFGLAIDNARE
jgi:hypothetical protein